MHKRLLPIFVACLLAACEPPPPQQGTGWKVVTQLTDGLKVRFVEITPGKQKDGTTYRDAVNSLCKDKNICVIQFFLPGDRVPATQGSREFFSNGGGLGTYPVLAMWWQNRTTGLTEFTEWDCERAGVNDAPPSALCGAGIREAYMALLDLAIYAAHTKPCRWPANDATAIAASYISSIQEGRRKEYFQRAYDDIYPGTQKSPNDPAVCRKRRAQIEASAKKAREVLKLPGK
jgi:hypothetical protein